MILFIKREESGAENKPQYNPCYNYLFFALKPLINQFQETFNFPKQYPKKINN
jgi:hypothetical protein